VLNEPVPDAGIANCFTRVAAEQGLASFWRGNLANVVRYFPTQAFNFAFKDTIKDMFPRYNPRTDFWKFFATNMASGALRFPVYTVPELGRTWEPCVQKYALSACYQRMVSVESR